MIWATILLTALVAMGTYGALSTWAVRREMAGAARRLTPAIAKRGPERARRPLIEAAEEMRGALSGRVLDYFRLRDSAARLLESAALKWRPSGLLQRSIAAFLAGFVTTTVFTGNAHPSVALAAGAAVGFTPVWYVRRRARRRIARLEEQFPDFLEFVSRSMRAGHAFATAIEAAYREFNDPLGSELRRVFEEQNLGQPLEVVLRKLGQRAPTMEMRFFVSAVLLQKRTGGNLAELLDKLARLIRERFKLRARIRAVSAQGLMSGRILSAIPAAVALMLFAVNPQYASFFVHDPLGRELIAAAGVMQLAGYIIIRKIVNIEA